MSSFTSPPPQVVLDWGKIDDNFTLVFETLFSSKNRKIHFDNVPDELSAVDGAKSNWCKLLLLDAMISILTCDQVRGTRRAFKQQNVLLGCILCEIRATNEAFFLSHIVHTDCKDFNARHVDVGNIQWSSLGELESSLSLNCPPSKAKCKYPSIVHYLCHHPSLALCANNEEGEEHWSGGGGGGGDLHSIITAAVNRAMAYDLSQQSSSSSSNNANVNATSSNRSATSSNRSNGSNNSQSDNSNGSSTKRRKLHSNTEEEYDPKIATSTSTAGSDSDGGMYSNLTGDNTPVEYVANNRRHAGASKDKNKRWTHSYEPSATSAAANSSYDGDEDNIAFGFVTSQQESAGEWVERQYQQGDGMHGMGYDQPPQQVFLQQPSMQPQQYELMQQQPPQQMSVADHQMQVDMHLHHQQQQHHHLHPQLHPQLQHDQDHQHHDQQQQQQADMAAAAFFDELGNLSD